MTGLGIAGFVRLCVSRSIEFPTYSSQRAADVDKKVGAHSQSGSNNAKPKTGKERAKGKGKESPAMQMYTPV